MHIVSNVIGKIKKEYDALSALIAGFPAGTVSGAPKIRAMEIIDELESEKRGIYAGCILISELMEIWTLVLRFNSYCKRRSRSSWRRRCGGQ